MKRYRRFLQFTLFLVATQICSTCSGPQHFNEVARGEEKNSKDVIPYLKIQEGDIVADLGAGGGHFSCRLARAVGNSGRVYAIEIDSESVAFIKKTAEREGLGNVETILATVDDSGLKDGSVNLVFIRNAYHDIENRVPYFSRLKKSLTRQGRVAIIDYDQDKLGFFRRLFGHALQENTIIEEMRSAGYTQLESIPVLETQSFNIFIPK